jgi:hypothetical protein
VQAFTVFAGWRPAGLDGAAGALDRPLAQSPMRWPA